LPNLPHQSPFGNPCVEGCPICDDEAARRLAAHLGLADEPDPTIEADARAAESVSWGLFSPDLPRTYRDEENPDELVEAWEFPGDDDRSWAAQFNEEGCAEDDLSPWEEALEILGERSWERACREHAEMMEEMELEHTYHLLIETLGGLPQEW
jgi:hypothetical protein